MATHGDCGKALEALGPACRPKGEGTKAGGPRWALIHARPPVLSPQPPAPCSAAGTAST